MITSPTAEIEKWIKLTLTVDNPDYIKKERMGKWTGNTPRTLSLYAQTGNDYEIPFGCLKDVWKMYPVKEAYELKISDLRRLEYQSNINLYPYQERAANQAILAKNGIVVMPCGSGKTVLGLNIIAGLGGRALWLTHTQDLLNQSMKSAEKCLTCESKHPYGTITEGKIDIGTHITFATIQTMCKMDLTRYKDYFDIVIVDECMPADTLIDTPYGKKKLKDLRIDDIITSYNRATGKLENKKVTHIFKNKSHDIVKVKLLNGEIITCTGNHPIFTNRGWIDAEIY